MSLLPECKSIQDQTLLVDRKIEQTLQQLENADPSQRPALLQRFRTLTARLQDLQNSLACNGR